MDNWQIPGVACCDPQQPSWLWRYYGEARWNCLDAHVNLDHAEFEDPEFVASLERAIANGPDMKDESTCAILLIAKGFSAYCDLVVEQSRKAQAR